MTKLPPTRFSRCKSPRRRLASLPVRVTPRSSRDRIEVGEPVKVYVTAPPADGEANDAVVRVVAKALGIAKSRVTVVKGHKSRDKVLEVADMAAAELQALLASARG